MSSIKLLIGHRGVGKTSLLKILSEKFSCEDRVFISLDKEIETREKTTIKDIFIKTGEKGFRDIECKTLDAIVTEYSNKQLVVDLGAGFLGPLPNDSQVIWIKRKTSSETNVFIDRPALDGSAVMSRDRFIKREKRYQEWAHSIVELREGERFFGPGEESLFAALFNSDETDTLKNWGYTLSPEEPRDHRGLLGQLGLGFIEFRDDLLAKAPQLSSHMTNLYARRSGRTPLEGAFDKIDTPIEWDDESAGDILSCHTRQDSLKATFAVLPKTDKILKVAIPIDSFSELLQGHRWWQEDPSQRAFLPMSDNGRWWWYRLLLSSQSPINFLRMDQGSAKDQPSLLQVLNYNPKWSRFAAILGAPITHSHTPTYHQEFFRLKECNVLGVHVEKEEVTEALPVLAELGLAFAAVTSPLKEAVAQYVEADSPAINTLAWESGKWHWQNTDPFGFQTLVKDISPDHDVVVWGGGGVLASLKEILPQAHFYSSRTGEPKGEPVSTPPKHLIWAVAADAFKAQGQMPPEEWSVEQIIDLNYTQNSPGLIYAHHLGCQYRSGLVMFQAQAEKQQEFWNEFGP